MFDIGSGELVVIGVVALVAIGPKELPGVLRMVGQWVAKARRMAGEFQSQFNEAMREAEMADLKKSFDEVSDAARGAYTGNVLTTAAKDIEDAIKGVETDVSASSSSSASIEPASSEPASIEAASTKPASPEPEAVAITEGNTKALGVAHAAEAHDGAEGKSAS